MNRRELLKRAVILMGGAISAPVVMGILKGCKAEPGVDWAPKYFSEEQAEVITTIAGIIIPKTDTLGAIETGVPKFIELMIHECYSPTDRDNFMNSLTSFMKDAETKTGEAFVDLDFNDQEAYILKIHKEAVEAKSDERPFILKMKELTMIGFFTTEEGMTKVLQYEMIPGHYYGCRPLKEIGRTWA